MELTKKQMRLVITSLESFKQSWDGVNEEDGTPIEFTDKTLKEFAEDIDFVAGVLDAFKKFYANAQVGN